MTASRVLRILLIVAAAAAAAVAGCWLMFRDDVEARIRTAIQDYAQGRAQEAMGVDVDGRRTIRIGSLDYGFLDGRLDVRDIDIVVSTRSAPASSDSITCRIGVLTCTGLSWWDVLVGDGLHVGDVDIRGVTLVRLQRRDTVTSPMNATLRLPRLPNVDSLVRTAVRRSLPQAMQSLSIVSLTIAVDSLRSVVVEGAMETATSYHRVDIRIADVGLRPKGLPFDELTLRIDRMERHFGDGRTLRLYGPTTVVPLLGHTVLTLDSVEWHAQDGYRSWAAGVVFDEAAARLSADSVHIRPLRTDAMLLATATHRLDRFDVAMGRITVDGVDLPAILAGTALHVRRVAVRGLALDVLSTKWQRRRPSTAPPAMPAALLHDAPFDVVVDTVSVWRATISYHEQTAPVRTPGTLHWSEAEVHMTNLQRGGSTTIGARAAFMGVAPMEARIELDLRTREHHLRAAGRLGRMDATSLNRFLPPTEGVRVDRGSIEGITFDVTVHGRAASGWVVPLYHGLSLDMVDKRTGRSSGILSSITSFLANWLVVRNDNIGADARRGAATMRLPEDASVMQTLWFPIRHGLGDVVGF